MARQIKAGSTDQSVVIRIVDATDGTPETGVVYNTSGIDLEYRRDGAASTDITEATLSALTDAHSDGGFLHIGNGYYRLDLPDAAVADGVAGVLIHGTVTGMVVIGEYIELVDYNPYDGVRLGLTALPNAAADAAGGLPISDAGGLDLDAKLAATNEITAARLSELDAGTSGKMANQVDEIRTDTEDLQTQVGTAGAGLTAVPWNAAWDAEVQSEVADALVAYDPPTNAEMEARTLAAASYGTAANQTTILARLGAWTGTARNTLLGWCQAITRKDADATMPSDINADLGAGVGTADNTTDSTQGIADSALTAAGVRTAVGLATANLDTQLADLPTAAENADKLLGRTIAGSADGGRTVKDALRALRNKVASAAGTLTVYAEDDTTPAWTAALTTDAAAEPIVTSDPA